MTSQLIPHSFSPFEGQEEPCGYCLRGFFEEFDLSRDGKIDYEKDFLPEFLPFLNYYSGRLPPLEEWINSYRHHIGLTYLFGQNPWQGAILEGFRFDFDLFYDPCFLAVDDLDLNHPKATPLSREKIFWRSLKAFVAQYRSDGPIQAQNLSRAWHDFLRIHTVCHHQTTLMGDYQTLGVQSYEEAYWEHNSKEVPSEAFKVKLRHFHDEVVKKEGYFLPSHFFENWQQFLRN